MKHLVLAASLLTIAPTFAVDTLDSGLASTISQDLDDICGDSWCEGDFNWSVGDLNCNFDKGTCKLGMTLIETRWDSDVTNDGGYYKKLDVLYFKEMKKHADIEVDGWAGEIEYSMHETCTLTGFHNVDDVSDGSTFSDKLYDAVLDQCVDMMENKYWDLQERAELLSKVRMCGPNIEVLNYEKDETPRRTNDSYYRRNYVEEREMKKLKNFVARVSEENFESSASLSYIANGAAHSDFHCQFALNSINSNWHTVALSTGWRRDNSEIAVRFTKKTRYKDDDSINVILKRNK